MKKMNNVKKMRWNMKNLDSLKWYFLIGALIGAVLFVLIYGFGVLNVTNDAWLLTGKDLQQHYIGWKYYRDAAWTFPIGLHDGLTHPYMVSVLYTTRFHYLPFSLKYCLHCCRRRFSTLDCLA